MESEIESIIFSINSVVNDSINELRFVTENDVEQWTLVLVKVSELSEEFLRGTINFLEIISRVFIGGFGIVGNCLSLLVLARQGHTHVTNMLLISLSACDFIYCLMIPVKMIRYIVDAYDPFETQSFITFWTVYIVNISIAVNFCSCSNAHVMVIALERVLAVLKPFHLSRIVTKQRVLICLLLLYPYVLVPVLFMTFVTLSHTWVVDSSTNRTYARVEFTRFYWDNYKRNQHLLCGTVETTSISPSASSSSSSRVSSSVSNLAHQRRVISDKSSATGARSDRGAGKILMSVCMSYAVCSFPTICYEHFKSGLGISDRYSLFVTFLDQVFQMFYNMNSAMNFVLYLMTSSKFSRAYREMFCGKCSKMKAFDTIE